MEAIRSVQGRVAPLGRADVDTDQIIPARYLTGVGKEGYAEGLFSDLKTKDESHFLNHERFSGAKIMAVGENFGCGSSREHAVWAIKGRGFRAILGKSFADIFSSNSAKNGLLLITMPAQVIEQIIEASATGDYAVSIDIEKQTVLLPDGEVHKFSYDEFRKHCLINGLDDIDYIRSHKDRISEYMKEREETRFCRTK